MAQPVEEPLILRPMTGHDRRRLRTRTKLIGAVRALVAENGEGGVQIADVTRRAGVGAGSFYNHFDSVEELVAAAVAEVLGELTEAMVVGVAEAEDPAVVVCDAARHFVRLAYESPDFARLLANLDPVDEVVSEAVYPEAGRALRAGAAAGRFKIADVEIALITTIGAALALMRSILAGVVGPEADKVFAEQAMRGLGIPPEEAGRLAGRELPPLPGLKAVPSPPSGAPAAGRR